MRAHNVFIVIEGDGEVKWEGEAKDSATMWVFVAEEGEIFWGL